MLRVEQLKDDIAANRVPGGSAFARVGAELIALTLEALDSKEWEVVHETTFEVADWLAGVKPSMAGVRNIAGLARREAERAPRDGAAEAVIAAMYAYIGRSEQALDRLTKHAGEVIADASRVLVHSFSASLVGILDAIASEGVSFELIVTESRPYRESRRLVEALAAHVIPITLYSDAAVCIAARAADRAIVGADTVFNDGSFANKTGSLPLALACERSEIPLYVATELSKVYDGDPADIEMELRPGAELADDWELFRSGRVQVSNQFFERVEAGLVTRYVTESGLILPSEVARAAAGRE